MKQRPGLPENYRLSLTEEDFSDREPADVGDFFEEDVSVPVREASFPKKIVPIREPASVPPIAASDEIFAKATPAQSRNELRRRQINMTPEVDDMLGELLDDIRRYSREKHPKAADLIHALLSLAHAARNEFSLSEVPPRGRWGSPTVKVYHDSLKATLKAAIALQHQKGEGSN